jgi:hypothetical protein
MQTFIVVIVIVPIISAQATSNKLNTRPIQAYAQVWEYGYLA